MDTQRILMVAGGCVLAGCAALTTVLIGAATLAVVLGRRVWAGWQMVR